MPCKILIVDDNRYVRTYVRAAIELRPDWVVCGEAESGEAAITMVETLAPHLVILDLSMPGMNGLETAKRISVISPGLPMIMFTMHESPRLEKEAQAVGIKQVFSKEAGFGDNVIESIKAMLALSA